MPTGNYYVIVMVYRGLDGAYNSGYTLGRKAGIVDYPQTASPSHADFFMPISRRLRDASRVGHRDRIAHPSHSSGPDLVSAGTRPVRRYN